jgi:hypothetical protein
VCGIRLSATDLIPVNLIMHSASGTNLPIMGAALLRIKAQPTGIENPARQEGGALAAGVRHGCGGEVLGLRAECVSMESEVLGMRRDQDVEFGLWWGSPLAP